MSKTIKTKIEMNNLKKKVNNSGDNENSSSMKESINEVKNLLQKEKEQARNIKDIKCNPDNPIFKDTHFTNEEDIEQRCLNNKNKNDNNTNTNNCNTNTKSNKIITQETDYSDERRFLDIVSDFKPKYKVSLYNSCYEDKTIDNEYNSQNDNLIYSNSSYLIYFYFFVFEFSNLIVDLIYDTDINISTFYKAFIISAFGLNFLLISSYYILTILPKIKMKTILNYIYYNKLIIVIIVKVFTVLNIESVAARQLRLNRNFWVGGFVIYLGNIVLINASKIHFCIINIIYSLLYIYVQINENKKGDGTRLYFEIFTNLIFLSYFYFINKLIKLKRDIYENKKRNEILYDFYQNNLKNTNYNIIAMVKNQVIYSNDACKLEISDVLSISKEKQAEIMNRQNVNIYNSIDNYLEVKRKSSDKSNSSNENINSNGLSKNKKRIEIGESQSGYKYTRCTQLISSIFLADNQTQKEMTLSTIEKIMLKQKENNLNSRNNLFEEMKIQEYINNSFISLYDIIENFDIVSDKFFSLGIFKSLNNQKIEEYVNTSHYDPEMFIYFKDIKYFDIYIRKSELFNKEILTEFLILNISAIKEAENQALIMETNKKAFSNIAHEFKTPLLTIISLISELQEQQEELNHINNENNNDSNYIKNICVSNKIKNNSNDNNFTQTNNLDIFPTTNINSNNNNNNNNNNNLSNLLLNQINIMSEYTLFLIDDIIYYSSNKDDQDKYKVMIDKVNINKVILFCDSILNSLIKVKGKSDVIDVVFNIPNELTSLVLLTDEIRIKQILLNFISNAVKFTKKGSISLTIEFNQSYLSISIEDTGCGIKDEDLNKMMKFNDNKNIFNDDKSGNRMGTGLGLNIAFSFCKKLGYEVCVKSIFNRGSCFGVKILKHLINFICEDKDIANNENYNKKYISDFVIVENEGNEENDGIISNESIKLKAINSKVRANSQCNKERYLLNNYKCNKNDNKEKENYNDKDKCEFNRNYNKNKSSLNITSSIHSPKLVFLKEKDNIAKSPLYKTQCLTTKNTNRNSDFKNNNYNFTHKVFDIIYGKNKYQAIGSQYFNENVNNKKDKVNIKDLRRMSVLNNSIAKKIKNNKTTKTINSCNFNSSMITDMRQNSSSNINNISNSYSKYPSRNKSFLGNYYFTKLKEYEKQNNINNKIDKYNQCRSNSKQNTDYKNYHRFSYSINMKNVNDLKSISPLSSGVNINKKDEDILFKNLTSSNCNCINIADDKNDMDSSYSTMKTISNNEFPCNYNHKISNLPINNKSLNKSFSSFSNKKIRLKKKSNLKFNSTKIAEDSNTYKIADNNEHYIHYNSNSSDTKSISMFYYNENDKNNNEIEDNMRQSLDAIKSNNKSNKKNIKISNNKNNNENHINPFFGGKILDLYNRNNDKRISVDKIYKDHYNSYNNNMYDFNKYSDTDFNLGMPSFSTSNNFNNNNNNNSSNKIYERSQQKDSIYVDYNPDINRSSIESKDFHKNKIKGEGKDKNKTTIQEYLLSNKSLFNIVNNKDKGKVRMSNNNIKFCDNRYFDNDVSSNYSYINSEYCNNIKNSKDNVFNINHCNDKLDDNNNNKNNNTNDNENQNSKSYKENIILLTPFKSFSNKVGYSNKSLNNKSINNNNYYKDLNNYNGSSNTNCIDSNAFIPNFSSCNVFDNKDNKENRIDCVNPQNNSNNKNNQYYFNSKIINYNFSNRFFKYLTITKNISLCIESIKSTYNIMNSNTNTNINKILIVDDSISIRKSLVKQVTNIINTFKNNNSINNKDQTFDFQIIEGSDGVDILYHFLKDQESGDKSIKYVFSDENMEYLNGSQAFSLLRELYNLGKFPNYNEVEFISITGYSDIDEIANIKNKGATKVISKPIKNKDLEELFRHV